MNGSGILIYINYTKRNTEYKNQSKPLSQPMVIPEYNNKQTNSEIFLKLINEFTDFFY